MASEVEWVGLKWKGSRPHKHRGGQQDWYWQVAGHTTCLEGKSRSGVPINETPIHFWPLYSLSLSYMCVKIQYIEAVIPFSENQFPKKNNCPLGPITSYTIRVWRQNEKRFFMTYHQFGRTNYCCPIHSLHVLKDIHNWKKGHQPGSIGDSVLKTYGILWNLFSSLFL